jgi:hypothetical protein
LRARFLRLLCNSRDTHAHRTSCDWGKNYGGGGGEIPGHETTVYLHNVYVVAERFTFFYLNFSIFILRFSQFEVFQVGLHTCILSHHRFFLS